MITINRKRSDRVMLLVVSALFVALIAVATSFIRIPAPHNGYTHAGDAMIYLSACILPPQYAIVSSSLGGFMADILAGAPEWAMPTAIIKALNVLPFIACRFFLKKYEKDTKILHPIIVAMLIPTSVITVVGYFIATGIMFGFEASFLATVVSGWLQPLVSAIAYLALGAALDAVSFKAKIYPNIVKTNLRKKSKA